MTMPSPDSILTLDTNPSVPTPPAVAVNPATNPSVPPAPQIPSPVRLGLGAVQQVRTRVRSTGGNGHGHGGNPHTAPTAVATIAPDAQALVAEERQLNEVRSQQEKLLPGNREAVDFEGLVGDRVVPRLQGYVRSLHESKGLTESQRDYFTDVIDRFQADLTSQYKLEGDNNQWALGYLRDVVPIQNPPASGESTVKAVEDQVVGAYRAELASLAAVFEGYPVANTNDQQKLAVLVLAEYMSNLTRGAADIADINQRLTDLGINTNLLTPIGPALTSLGTEVPETFDGFVSPMLVATAATMISSSGNSVLKLEEVDGYLENRAAKAYGDLVKVVAAIDGMEAEADKRVRKRNSEALLGAGINDNPFRHGWADKVQETHEGKFTEVVLSSTLGDEKVAKSFWGEQHTNMRAKVERRTLYGPIADAKGRDHVEEFVGGRLTVSVGLWAGEVKRGTRLKSGEVADSKDFFNKVVDMSVLELAIDSADSAANALMQIEAAKALNVNSGEFKGTSKDIEDAHFLNELSAEEYKNAKTFAIPVMGRDDKPTYVILKKEDLIRWYDLAKECRASFAKYAEKDPRYKARPWSERAGEFGLSPQVNETSLSTFKEEVSNVAKIQVIAREQMEKLGVRRPPNTLESYKSAQIDEALTEFTEKFADFEANYCRYSCYEREARKRLLSEGMVDNGSPAWHAQMNKKIKEIVLEYAHKANAYRVLTKQVVSTKRSKELEHLLGNIDYEFDMLVAIDNNHVTPWEAKKAAHPFLRSPETFKYNLTQLENMHGFARLDLEAGAARFTGAGGKADDFSHVARLAGNAYLEHSLLRISQYKKRSVTTIAADGDPVVEQSHQVNARNARIVHRLVAKFRSPSRGNYPELNYLRNTDAAERYMDYPNIYGTLPSDTSVTFINERYGPDRARFKAAFHREPSESEARRYFDTDIFLVRTRLNRILDMRRAAALLTQFGEEVARVSALHPNDLETYEGVADASVVASARSIIGVVGSIAQQDIKGAHEKTLWKTDRLVYEMPTTSQLAADLGSFSDAYTSRTALEEVPEISAPSAMV